MLTFVFLACAMLMLMIGYLFSTANHDGPSCFDVLFFGVPTLLAVSCIVCATAINSGCSCGCCP